MDLLGREKIKLRYIFLSTSSLTLITILSFICILSLVFFFWWEKELIKKIEWIFWILWGFLFIFITFWLYFWVILKNDNKFPAWKFDLHNSSETIYNYNISNLLDFSGDDIFSIIIGIIGMLVFLLIIIPLILEFISFLFFLLLVIVWSISKSLRIIFKKSAFCSRNPLKSISYWILYSFLYSWIIYWTIFYNIHNSEIKTLLLKLL